MSEYPPGNNEDREMLAALPSAKLLDFFFLQIRNLWRVDGLYFLSIEKEFGTGVATEIDAEVWKTMATIEAKSLQKMFQTQENPSIFQVIDLLRKSSWALDQPFKTIAVDSRHATLWVKRCRTQETRLAKGMPEFPCKQVRFGYLKNFVESLNPKISVNCLVCPPDTHPKKSWCRWEFPGGKIEENESPEECLKRELHEELDIEVNVRNLFMESIHSYSGLDVDILAFNTDFVNGSFKLTSHNQIKWVKPSELGTYDFTEADKPIVAKLME